MSKFMEQIAKRAEAGDVQPLSCYVNAAGMCVAMLTEYNGMKPSAVEDTMLQALQTLSGSIEAIEKNVPGYLS
jgi:hypothetical protein